MEPYTAVVARAKRVEAGLSARSGTLRLMASFTLRRPDVFPNGTTVSVYPRAGSGVPDAGAPVGAAAASAAVASDAVTFSTLAEQADFVSYASSPDRYVSFSTRGQWGASGPAVLSEFTRSRLSTDGVWTWFNDPRAVYVTNAGTRLMVFGEVVAASGGSPAVVGYNLDTTDVMSFTLKTALQQDDHDNPSFLVLPDNRLLAFYCRHAVNADPLYVRRTTNPADVGAWNAETQITANVAGTHGYSYPKPVRVASESKIYVFFRGADYAQCYVSSTDNGVTWSAATRMFANGTERPYFQVAHDNANNRIHFTCTDGHPRDVNNNLYHFYYAASDSSFHKSDGTVIATRAAVEGGAPVTPATATKVYDNATSGKAWGWELMVDTGGNPRVVYAVFPTDVDHRYRYARWTGSAWQDAQICAAGADIHPDTTVAADGEPSYSGGVAINPADPTVVYASTQRSVTGWDIDRYVTANNGLTFAFDAPVTSGSVVKNVRPWVPRALPVDAPSLLFLRGADGQPDGGYTSWTTYRTEVHCAPSVVISTRPSPPTGLTAYKGSTEVLLSWSASALGAPTSYKLFRGTSAGSLTEIAEVSSSTFSYMDTGRTNGTQYFYDVAGVNASGTGTHSSQVSVTPAATLIVNDAVTTANAANTNGTSWSHTVAADANFIVIAFALTTPSATSLAKPAAVSGVTVGGQAASFVTGSRIAVAQDAVAGTARQTEMWYLANPPTGAQTIAFTLPTPAGAAAAPTAAMVGRSYKGAAGLLLPASGTVVLLAQTVSASTVAPSGSKVIASGSFRANSAPTAGGGQTVVVTPNNSTLYGLYSEQNGGNPAVSTANYNNAGANDSSALAAVALLSN
jgi:hypothetical protein